MLEDWNTGKSKDHGTKGSNDSKVLFFKSSIIPPFQYSIVPGVLRRNNGGH
jgi:hypothetical protein